MKRLFPFIPPVVGNRTMAMKKHSIQVIRSCRSTGNADISALSSAASLRRMLVRELMDSYSRSGCVNYIDGENLPSKDVIIGTAKSLLQLLFPGFFSGQVNSSSSIRRVTNVLLSEVTSRLASEVEKSLKLAPPDGVSRSEVSKLAQKQTLGFLSTLPRVRELLETDTKAAYEGDPAALNREEIIVAYPFVEAIAVQRLAHELYLLEVPLIPRMMTEWAHSRTGMDLHPGAQIGSHFFIDHGTGTVIGETAEIGNHVKLYQSVGLVAKSLGAGRALRGRKRHPTIRDRVTVYAGATIVGGDTVVGEGSTIGASVFLTGSVPPDSLVVLEATNVKVTPKIRRFQLPNVTLG
jgi:serine O-acetyltransferase